MNCVLPPPRVPNDAKSRIQLIFQSLEESGSQYKKARLPDLCRATAPVSGPRFPVYCNGKLKIASLIQVEITGPDGNLAAGSFHGPYFPHYNIVSYC